MTSGTVDHEPGTDPEISLTSVETAYCGLDCSTLEAPPAAVVYDSLSRPEYVNTDCTTHSELMLPMSFDESQIPADFETLSRRHIDTEYYSSVNTPAIDAGMSSSNVALLSYVRLEPSTLEPLPAPVIYDRLVGRDYANIDAETTDEQGAIIRDEPAQAAVRGISSNVSRSSADETQYFTVERRNSVTETLSSADIAVRGVIASRELPTIPVVEHHTGTDHYSTITSPAIGACGSSSSDVTLQLSVDETSYCRLECFTREPSPPPTVYQSLITPDYVNVTSIEARTQLMSDEPQSDSGILLNTSTLSEVETSV